MVYAVPPPEVIDCSRCMTTTYHVHAEDLSGAGHFALWYALALIGGEGSRAASAFQKGLAKVREKHTDADLRAALQQGLKELLDKSLMDATRDGEGGLVPRVLYLQRLVANGAVALA